MKIPLKPPALDKLIGQFLFSNQEDLDIRELIAYPHTSNLKEYIHWDKLRHLGQHKDWPAEKTWFVIKLARLASYRPLPFVDVNQQTFQLNMSIEILTPLIKISDYFNKITLEEINPHWKDSHLFSSVTEEAITSSQLEGASTTRKVAKEMLRTHRKPRTQSEQMIVNNYRAMQFIKEVKDEKLTPQLIFELHKIITEKTLHESECGKIRTAKDNIQIWDNRDQTILHTPPKAKELKKRINKICDFANTEDNISDFYKAIILHFMLAYDHPFNDGNGRTARALFYWYMLKHNYYLVEFISISKIIKNAPSQYAKAFLYTETDDNDITYFMIHQLNVILKAIKELKTHLEKEKQEIETAKKLLKAKTKLEQKLNHRQMCLINHALKHPDSLYTIEAHRTSHDITYETARSDLLKLSKLQLFKKEKQGKAFVFRASSKIKIMLIS